MCKPVSGEPLKEAGVEMNKDMQTIAKVRDHVIPEEKINGESDYAIK